MRIKPEGLSRGAAVGKLTGKFEMTGRQRLPAYSESYVHMMTWPTCEPMPSVYLSACA